MSSTELLSIKEVANRLHMTQRGLWNWRRTGAGPKGAVIGGKLLYRAADVERYVREAFGEDVEASA